MKLLTIKRILGIILLSFSLNMVSANDMVSGPLTFKKTNIGVILSWSTDYEKDTKLFAVEKSSNGEHFTQIGEVKSKGDLKNGFEYSFVDLFPQVGTSYYRLKLINKDGTFSHLETIATKLIQETNFTISNFSTDNPSNSWSINLDVYKNGSLVFEWKDRNGAVIEEGIKRVSKGFNRMSFSMLTWPNGIYRLNMDMDGDSKTVAIEKNGESTIQVAIEK